MSKEVQSFSSAGSALTIDEIIAQLQSVQRTQFTGRLDILGREGQSWMLYFRLGRLIWSTCKKHRFRRWRRCMQNFCPEVAIDNVRLRDSETEHIECVEYVMLSVLVQRNHVSRDNAIIAINQNNQEVLFELCCNLEKLNTIVLGNNKSEIRGDALVLLNGEQYFQRIVALWQSWCLTGLALHSPNLSLQSKNLELLKSKASHTTYQRLVAYIEDSSTLWDMAIRLKKDVATVAQLLLPYLSKGILGLKDVPDLPPPDFSRQTSTSKKAGSDCPLVIYIDDSKVLCDQMAVILSENYRFIGVSDSVQALSTLLSNKPDIIFLDLIMPVASGYEICTQIRRVSALKDIPVIILTGKDGIIDRVRAKMVGASDFLSKPVESEAIMEVLTRYLPDYTPKASMVPRMGEYAMGDATAFAIRQSLINSE
jgi:two-component system, chemotaxis family, response regulator PixG